MISQYTKTLAVAGLVVVLGTATIAEVSGYGYGGGSSSSGTRVKERVMQQTPVSTPSSPSSAKFIFNTDLSIGMSGNDVLQLQKRLRELGFFTFPTDTGFFGPVTQEAVRKFQEANPEIGFVTGFFGPLTRAVMNR
jgi:peptidoglycan hydrolase-like protein with peptidoglycan-binding domain